jgi:Ni,Fe-hydrogenase maturation factor
LSDKSPYDDIYSPEIMILGVGCTLYSDEGFGVRVIETIQERYEFPGCDFQTESAYCGGCHPQ